MFGISSISELRKRVDLYNKVDWQEAKRGMTPAVLACARDPFAVGLTAFPFSPVAIWGLEPRLSAIRIASGDLSATARAAKTKADRSRAEIDLIAALAPYLLKNAEFQPSIEQLAGLLRNTKYASEFFDLNLGDYVQNLSDSHILTWIRVNSIHLALLLERSVVRVGAQRDSALRPEANSQLHQIAGLVHDYHAFRLPFWRSTPMVLVSSQISQAEIAHLRDIFADPLSFDPSQSERMDRFYWPWQRCLSSSYPNEVRYRPIATTSLALDVRASTSAMELTDPPDKFSEFIDAVVSGARSRILKHGGYFDKETGDGIIGHFCSHGNVPTSSNNDLTAMEIVAVRAGQEIVQFVRDLSAGYQRWLRHGMDRLGAAIGIHTGTAVWLVDEMQIRAIGSSVVGAARLCNCAEAGEIVVSNKTYHAVEEFQGAVAGLTFRKKEVSLQEYGERLGTYAYAARAVT